MASRLSLVDVMKPGVRNLKLLRQLEAIGTGPKLKTL